jgi:hypothetical protein
MASLGGAGLPCGAVGVAALCVLGAPLTGAAGAACCAKAAAGARKRDAARRKSLSNVFIETPWDLRAEQDGFARRERRIGGLIGSRLRRLKRPFPAFSAGA